MSLAIGQKVLEQSEILDSQSFGDDSIKAPEGL